MSGTPSQRIGAFAADAQALAAAILDPADRPVRPVPALLARAAA